MSDINEYLSALDLTQLVETRKAIDGLVKNILEEQERQFAETRALLGLDETKKRMSARKGSTVAPKYRNPKDESQTWSGRGLPPKWITESGRKKEYFLIDKPVKNSKKKEDTDAITDGAAFS